MKKLNLKVWIPSIAIEGALELVEFKYSKGLQITLEDIQNNTYQIQFNKEKNGNYILACRFADEMKRSDLAEPAFQARKNEVDTVRKSWSLYKAINSDFVDWYDQLPGPGSEHYHIDHYIIVTSDETFEILSEVEPTIIKLA
ncbi:hypothetical protein ACTQ5K_18100 [Niallia sp. Sow4_A1]|jgi:hypothetical protein|uniref:Uncharacterized protein n=1 Tax=Niallia hominis TaxID=3133173 RepID=A0ABV1EVU6_9BACI|nr:MULTISPECIES: hypothetical protein [Bacillaceae]MCF2646427.1 hypothetical protein [Niallia circulans]MCM3361671.1 hypothetical protein [Niallia sp. MER TA 168]CAI9395397.1 hypothetical protein BACSP_04067 [Bacillus sp. T2.9-1]